MASHGIWTPWSDTHNDLYETTNKANYFFNIVSYTLPLTETDGCNLPQNTVYVDNYGFIYYNSDSDMAGFQVNVIGVDVMSASGGDAEEAGFMIMTSANTIMGFSLSGSVIPAGCGVLTESEFENGTPLGLTDIIISDAIGGGLSFTDLNTFISPEDWVGAFYLKGTCSDAAATTQAVCDAVGGAWSTEEILVGAKQWNITECGQYICDLAVYGVDPNNSETENYMTANQTPTFKIYNTEEATSYAAVSSNLDIPWANNTSYEIEYLFAGPLDSEDDMEITYNIHKWNNLVSFPLDLGTTNSPADVFGSDANQDIIGIIGQGVAKSFNPATETWSGSLNAISPTAGYWIRTSDGPFVNGDDPTLQVSGSFIENPTYNWTSGYTLISFPGSESSPVGNHFPVGVGAPWQNEFQALLGEGTSCIIKEGCSIDAFVCSVISTGALLSQYTNFDDCRDGDGTGCSDPQYTTVYSCRNSGTCSDAAYTGQGVCEQYGNIWTSAVWTHMNHWGESTTSCTAAGGVWRQVFNGSLMHLQPNKGYWLNLSADLNNFQFNLVKESYCTDPTYTDQSTCEAAGFAWRDRLVNA